eukprot:scaffold3955_cov26-Tisochrysis_lutea.AAC.1
MDLTMTATPAPPPVASAGRLGTDRLNISPWLARTGGAPIFNAPMSRASSHISAWIACMLNCRCTDGGLATLRYSRGTEDTPDRVSSNSAKVQEAWQSIVDSRDSVKPGGGEGGGEATAFAAASPPAACIWTEGTSSRVRSFWTPELTPIGDGLVKALAPGMRCLHLKSTSPSLSVSSCVSLCAATSLSSKPPANARRRLRPSLNSEPTLAPARLKSRSRRAFTSGRAAASAPHSNTISSQQAIGSTRTASGSTPTNRSFGSTPDDASDASGPRSVAPPTPFAGVLASSA